MPKRGATSRTCPAGGFGFGCMALLGGTLRPGIETLLDLAGFDRLLERADLVITGEGRLDGQSLRGKVISGVARRAKGRVPVIAIVGGIADDAVPAYGLGVDAMFSIDRAALPFPESAPRSEGRQRDDGSRNGGGGPKPEEQSKGKKPPRVGPLRDKRK